MNFYKFLNFSIFAVFLAVFLFSIFNFIFLDKVFATEADITCVKYGYPWCQQHGEGDIAGLVNQFYLIALGFAGASAFGVLIYGAILWTLSGVVTKKQDAMEWISGALWGLGLLLGAWLILYTINPELVILKNPEIEKVEIKPLPQTPFINPNTGNFTGGGSGGGMLSDYMARELLSMKKIGVKQNCTQGQDTGCVSLTNIRSGTVNEIANLADQVGSENIFITAGTEGCGTIHVIGMYSHCTGYKIDLRRDNELDNYITKNFAYMKTRNDGTKVYINPSNPQTEYALESDHWDVLVK